MTSKSENNENKTKILIYVDPATRAALDTKVLSGYKISSLVRLFITEGLARMESTKRVETKSS